MRTRMSYAAASCAAVLTLLASACDDASLGSEGCETEADCPSETLCVDQRCVTPCNSHADCPRKNQACEEGTCHEVEGAVCNADVECATPDACSHPDGATCVAGECTYPPRTAGTPCDDGDPCTEPDACDGNGQCAGIPKLCTDIPPDECGRGDAVFRQFIPTCVADTGACLYVPHDTDCPACATNCLAACANVTCDDLQAGCRTSGRCDPSAPSSCIYETVSDGSVCDRTAPSRHDGVCAGGACEECRVDGDCDAPPGAHPECFDARCTGNACGYSLLQAKICEARKCVDGVEYEPRVCGANGDCPIAGAVSCDGLRCNAAGDACLASCQNSDDCLPGYVCPDGSCEPSGEVGSPCTGTNQGTCTAGLECVDGVCCDAAACDGICMACGSDGLCSATPADDARCGTIACDGLDTTCRDFHDLNTDRCASFGTCKEDNSADCTSFTDALATTECRAAASDCDAAEHCDGAGTCPADEPEPDGTSCDDGDGCTTTDACGGGVCAGDALVDDSCGKGWYTDFGASSKIDFVGTSTGYTSAYGIGWGDYDGDGLVDLWLGDGGRLYHNAGDGSFELADTFSNTKGGFWADPDNDGDLDLFGGGGTGHFLENQGASGFVDRTVDAALEGENLGTVPWLDADRDGWIDLFFTNGVTTGPPYNEIRRNNGDAPGITFTLVDGPTIGLENGSSNGDACVVADVDDDGDLDVWYSGEGAGSLYFGYGNGVFDEGAAGVGLAIDMGTQQPYYGIGFADYDNDGDLDAFFGHPDGIANRLYVNEGDRRFTLSSALNSDLGHTQGIAWGDIDNDGDLDLLVGNDGVPNELFRNDGGVFTPIATGLGLDGGSDATGSVSLADYDNDGDLDVYVTNRSSANVLWRSEVNDDKHLAVRVVGAGGGFASRDGIGSRVELYDGDGDTLLAVREVSGGQGFGTQPPQLVHFGLAAAWGGGHGTYSVRVRFVDGEVRMRSGVVPVDESIVIGPTTIFNAIEVLERCDGATDCDDGEVCTNDACQSGVCAHTAVADGMTACDDGEGCTQADTCTAGACRGTDALCESFTDVTAAAGVATIGGDAYGIGWGDYDNDGYPDLWDSNGSVLYHNEGNGTFTIALGPRTSGSDYARPGYWADANNDGYLDLFVRRAAPMPHEFHQNRGDGTFVERAVAANLDDVYNLGAVTWLDCDNDGWMDLFMPEDTDSTNAPDGISQIRANGGGNDPVFTRIPGDAIGLAAGSGNGEVTMAADVNGDGFTDIWYSGESGGNLYLNDGDGTFTESAAASGLAIDMGLEQPYYGASFADYDNDGDLDVFLGHPDTTANRLYQNDGDGTFTRINASVGPNVDLGHSRGVAWGDYDNDGDLDLLIGNDGTPDALFENQGDGTFVDVAPALGLDFDGNTGSISFADYDSDGDLDIYRSSDGQASLWRNNRNDDAYLRIVVQRHHPSASVYAAEAIGSRVELWDAGESSLLAIREVSGGGGYGTQEPQAVHFGLAGIWGGAGGTYTVKVRFVDAAHTVVTRSNVVPNTESVSMGATTLRNTIRIRQP